MVDATQEVENAVLELPRQISSLVQARPRLGRKRVRDEPLGGERGPIVIAPSDLNAPNVQFALGTDRNQLQ